MTGKTDKYSGCVLELANDGIVEIVCEDEDKKKDLIELISGMQVEHGSCRMGDIATDTHLKEYKKMVDLIDMDRVESTLSVKDYLVFYAMVKGIYEDGMSEAFTELLRQMDMPDVVEKQLNTLSRLEKIKVRAVASYLKKVNCLVCKDVLEELEFTQQRNVISFLKDYFCRKHCLCLLFEKGEAQLDGQVDTVLVI